MFNKLCLFSLLKQEEPMDVPSKNHEGWYDIITGKRTFELKFLAAKIMLGRLLRGVHDNPTPQNISTSIDQLYNLFAQNTNSRTVQDDIKTIFGK